MNGQANPVQIMLVVAAIVFGIGGICVRSYRWTLLAFSLAVISMLVNLPALLALVRHLH